MMSGQEAFCLRGRSRAFMLGVCLLWGPLIGCEGDDDGIVACHVLGDANSLGTNFCHVGSSLPGTVPPGCTDSGDIACSGGGYGAEWDGSAFVAWADCPNSPDIRCEGSVSGQAGVDANGKRYVACIGPFYSSFQCS